jgi:hypothetical protein
MAKELMKTKYQEHPHPVYNLKFLLNLRLIPPFLQFLYDNTQEFYAPTKVA